MRRCGEVALRVALLHNPGAGGEDHDGDELARLIRQAGHEVVDQHAGEDGWERDLDDTTELIAVAGGDGTVGKALLALADPETPRVPVTVLPLGSANNIARELGLDGDPAELIAGWDDAGRSRYRLGEIATDARRLTFLEGVGGGLIAAGIERAQQVENGDDDKVALGLRVLRRLVETLDPNEWRIELDGVDHGGTFLAVEVMLIGETGPRIPLAPAADPEDRLLDVVLVSDTHRDELADYLDERLAGHDVAAPPALTVHRCEHAVLEPPDGSPFRIDDRLWPDRMVGRADVQTRVTVDVLRPT